MTDMRYSTVKRSLKRTCRRCINKRYRLSLTPADCFYHPYQSECHRCHKTRNIVTSIRSRWKLWNAFPVAVIALVLFVALVFGLRTVDVATIQTTASGSVRVASGSAVAGSTARIGLSTLNLAIHEQLSVRMAIFQATQWLGYAAILVAAAFAVNGAVQMFRRGLRGVDPAILALGGLYIIVISIYVLFELFVVNYRPVLLSGELEASFPSSHTMIACVVFGSASMVLTRMRIPWQTVWAVGVQMLMVVTVVARFMCGVHWFTDVLGGVLISVALLAGFAEVLKRVTGAKE